MEGTIPEWSADDRMNRLVDFLRDGQGRDVTLMAAGREPDTRIRERALKCNGKPKVRYRPVAETIQEKADMLISANLRDVVGLLHAIADGQWTPEDARELKAAQDAEKETE